MTFDLEPVTRDRRGKSVSEVTYKTGDFYAQIGEALMTAHESAIYLDFLAEYQNADDERLKEEAQDEIRELIGLMTAVATRIKALADEHGYGVNDLIKMENYVIRVNRSIGCLDKN